MRPNNLATLAIVLALGANAHADNWPQFRGPHADGVAADDPRLPNAWSETENVRWTIDVPGLGWSSPIVWDGKVFLTSVTSEKEGAKPKKGLYLGQGVREPEEGVHHWLVFCFDLETGKELWRREAHRGEPAVPRHPKSSYAAETMATDGERVYAMFGDLGVYAYTLDGEPLWRHEIEPQPTTYDYGAAASPVVHDGQVIYVYDNLEESYIAALDAATGKENWRTPRDESRGWATPLVWQNDQRTEIVVPGKNRNRSYDLQGNLLWEFDGNMSGLIIPSPLAAHGMVYLSAGYIGDAHRPVFAVKPGASGELEVMDDPPANDYIEWYQPTAAPYNPSPIVYGDYYYTLYDRGFLTCHDAKTGEEVYGKQRFAPGASFTASPWAYNGRIFCLSEDADTYVVKAGPEYELLGTNQLDGLALATPAIADGNLLIRTAGKLYCISNEH